MVAFNDIKLETSKPLYFVYTPETVFPCLPRKDAVLLS